jgi:5'-nucleotidase
LTLPILAPIFAAGAPYLPPLISLNINYASISDSCASTSDFKYVFTRILANSSTTDVETCGTDHLPAEGTVVDAGCYATISVFNATDKADVDASTQAVVLEKLKGILSCYDA